MNSLAMAVLQLLALASAAAVPQMPNLKGSSSTNLDLLSTVPVEIDCDPKVCSCSPNWITVEGKQPSKEGSKEGSQERNQTKSSTDGFHAGRRCSSLLLSIW